VVKLQSGRLGPVSPPLDDETADHVEGRPGAAEHEPATDTGEHEGHAGQREPSARRHVAAVRERNDARHGQDHEDAGREERDAKHRHRASALADLQTIRSSW